MAELDPVDACEIIEGELGAFSEKLLEKPMIVVATKLDATTDHTKLDELRKVCKKRGLEFHAISAAAAEGVKELVRGIADELDRIPKETLADENSGAEEVNAVKGPEEEERGFAAYEGDDDDEEHGERGAASGRNS